MARRATGKDPDWTDRDAEGQPDLEEQPPGVDAENAMEGTLPPRDRPLGAEEWGTTEREQVLGETLDQRVERERPDVFDAPAVTDDVADTEGSVRVADPPDLDELAETEPATGDSAEEAAVRVIEP